MSDLKAQLANLTEKAITYHFHQNLRLSDKSLLESQGTSRQPDHEISRLNGKLRLNLDLIQNSTSEVGIGGDPQVMRSQALSEIGTSPSTSLPTIDARRNIILFENDRCTINFDMEFNVGELEGELASLLEQNMQGNDSLRLKSIPATGLRNRMEAHGLVSANAAHSSSDIPMPSIAPDMLSQINDALSSSEDDDDEDEEHTDGRILEGISEEARKESTGAHAVQNQRYKCSQPGCQKEYASRRYLQEHLKTHAGVKPYKCPHCKSEFFYRGSLRRHMRGHTEKILFKCRFCGKEIGSKDNLRYHENKHLGEMPYKCNSCENRYASPVDLSRHKATHHTDNC